MSIVTPINKLKIQLNENKFFVKRDDLLTFSFGGNKARKAMIFFDDIKERKCDAVVTYGSSSSNHCRIVANLAAANNLKCFIVSPQEGYEKTYNSQMVDLFGAKIIKTPLNCVANTINGTMKELEKFHKPYFIQGGGHGNLGTQAYVDAYFEICNQEEEKGVKFDYIFFASGTGTTQAGLIAGKIKASDNDRKIVGISIARTNPRGKDVIVDSLKEYFNDGKDYSSEVIFTDKYVCDGYGSYNQEIVQTIKDTLKNDGMALNLTYTGKAFWGMKRYIQEMNIKGKNILFINTGGTPLFFDDLEELKK